MTIAVMNPKGGVGKTTVAIHLARYFQKAGYKVALFDADPQASAHTWAVRASLLPCFGVRHESLASSVDDLKKVYDMIIIDGAAKLEASLLVPTLQVSDMLIIPVQPSALDIWGAVDLAGLAHTREQTIGRPRSFYLINRQIQGTALADDMDDALQQVKLPLLSARLSQRVAFAEAIAAGSTVLDHEPGGKAAAEVNALGDELTTLLHNGKEKNQTE